MLVDRILTEIAFGTVIPKPAAKAMFKFKGEGILRGERAIFYSIPNRKNPHKSGQKGVTASQLEKAYEQLLKTGRLTRDWWNTHVRHAGNEGGCNFTTVGGLLQLLGEAEYVERGIFAHRAV
jgi:hypothetical protein